MSAVFEEIIIASLHDNQIPLRIELDHMARALRSAAAAVSVIVKLAKRGAQAVLTFDMQRSQQSELTSTFQDVPVKVEHVSKLQDCAEPDVPEPACKVLLPKLRVLSRVLDKLKTLSDELTIEASDARGEMQVAIRTDLCSVRTFFKNLKLDPSSSAAAAAAAAVSTASTPLPHDVCALQLSAKKLSNALHCAVLNPRHVVACLVCSAYSLITEIELSHSFNLTHFESPTYVFS